MLAGTLYMGFIRVNGVIGVNDVIGVKGVIGVQINICKSGVHL